MDKSADTLSPTGGRGIFHLKTRSALVIATVSSRQEFMSVLLAHQVFFRIEPHRTPKRSRGTAELVISAGRRYVEAGT